MTDPVPSARAPLAIAVVGVGKIGSTLAYQLAQAGHHITVVARPNSQRLQELTRDQAIVTFKGDRAAVTVADHLDPTVPYDLALVTTLAHQVDAILPALQESKAGCIHFMFNIFEPERLIAAVGASRATFGMPMVVASLNAEGQLRPIISANRKTVHGDARWVALFNESGVPSIYEEDMLGWLRCQAAVCVAMEAISIAAVRGGRSGASWKQARSVTRGLQSIFKIIKQLGYPVFPRPKAMMASAPGFLVSAMLWLVSRVPPIRNAMSNGVDECQSIIDEVVRVARDNQGRVPEKLIAAVEAIKPDTVR